MRRLPHHRIRVTVEAPVGPEPSDFGVRRLRMVEEQVVRRGLGDENVLAAMRSVPRHLFVPIEAEEDAYADTPLPIGLGQTISQPYMVALMTSLLEVDVRSRVLEIGAGSGYQTAVLAEVAGEVFAIERLAPLAERARAQLARLGYSNVHLVIGDGAKGWHEQAPFQAILVAAAADEAPPELLGQLADGGRLVVPVGRGRGDQVLTIIERRGDAFEARRDTRCRFVPLVRDASPEERRANAVRGTAEKASRPRRGGEGARGGSTYPEEEAGMKSVEVKVTGLVQGVYYRASARREALLRGLRGWVRNASDGTVVLRLQGDPSAVEAMLDWCRVGPPAARVSRLSVSDAPADDSLHDFEVR
jgi:protein-L-isoaspartate(D-aspartate) O-methyltransferase